MSKNEPKKQSNYFEMDEQGLNEVSEQIMGAYNSGFMGEEEAKQKAQQTITSEDLT